MKFFFLALAAVAITPSVQAAPLDEDVIFADNAGNAAATSRAKYIKAGGEIATVKSVVSTCVLSNDLKLKCAEVKAQRSHDPIGARIAAATPVRSTKPKTAIAVAATKSVQTGKPTRLAVAFSPKFMASLKEKK